MSNVSIQRFRRWATVERCLWVQRGLENAKLRAGYIIFVLNLSVSCVVIKKVSLQYPHAYEKKVYYARVLNAVLETAKF